MNKIAVIVGTGRCGSHFLRDILGLHRNVTGSYENYFTLSIVHKLGLGTHKINDMFAAIKQNSDSNNLKHFNSICNSIGKDTESICSALYSNNKKMDVIEFIDKLHYSLFNNAKIIIDKSHAYGAILPEILPSMKEGTKIINIVRDGVTTARSMAQHDGYQKVIGNNISPNKLPYYLCEGNLAKLPASIPSEEKCYEWWVQSVSSCLNHGKSMSSKDFITIRYEDMITDTYNSLLLLIEFLELQPDPEWFIKVKKIIYPDAYTRQYTSLSHQRYNEIQAANLKAQSLLGYSFPVKYG